MTAEEQAAAIIYLDENDPRLIKLWAKLHTLDLIEDGAQFDRIMDRIQAIRADHGFILPDVPLDVLTATYGSDCS